MRIAPILAALSAVLYGVMIWLSLSVLKPAAGGLTGFDGRVFGYTLGEARSYLDALDSTGRALYLVEMRLLDSAFPVVFALFLGQVTLQLAARLHPWSRMILVLPAAGFAMMDLAENALVAGLLRAGSDGVDAASVALASQFTVSKWVLFLISVALIAGLWFVRFRQTKKQQG